MAGIDAVVLGSRQLGCLYLPSEMSPGLRTWLEKCENHKGVSETVMEDANGGRVLANHVSNSKVVFSQGHNLDSGFVMNSFEQMMTGV